jgi:two-component sensor histidine kinase
MEKFRKDVKQLLEKIRLAEMDRKVEVFLAVVWRNEVELPSDKKSTAKQFWEMLNKESEKMRYAWKDWLFSITSQKMDKEKINEKTKKVDEALQSLENTIDKILENKNQLSKNEEKVFNDLKNSIKKIKTTWEGIKKMEKIESKLPNSNFPGVRE